MKKIAFLVCLMCVALVVWCDGFVLRGRVEAIDHSPLSGAVIVIKENGERVYTDDKGQFAIALPMMFQQVHVQFVANQYHKENLHVNLAELPAELVVVMTPLAFSREAVTVTAPRIDTLLTEIPAAVTVVTDEALETAPRGIGAEEALRSVPGVKVDNQADGERVHLSIRGQGILSEHGIRGIQVMLDGIPINDPSGFAPDLYDVDWLAVESIDVIRGPVAFLYGGGSAGGLINIRTREGAPEPIGGSFVSSTGSYSFWKTYGEAGGTLGNVNYHVSASRNMGDGYRDHTAFWANNVYAKAGWQAAANFHLQAVFAGTGFFNENAEGLNLSQLNNRRMANPDAITYNEYQETQRLTGGVVGRWDIAADQHLDFSTYYRHTAYDESVPSSVIHRLLDAPGIALQYAWKAQLGSLTSTFNAGLDSDWQAIGEFRKANLGNAEEGPDKISDQNGKQSRLGFFAIEKVDLSAQWGLQLGMRYDRIRNEFTDILKANGLDLSGETVFEKATARVGMVWNPKKNLGFYASWGQGFLPPATEELYANPDRIGGFNTHLTPATSSGEEIGVRGSLSDRFFYDVALFHLQTWNDFERYRVSARPLETFYRNAGNTRRFGLETQIKWYPLDALAFTAAYTYSDFTYSDYASITFNGNMQGNILPNTPRHQGFLQLDFKPGSQWRLSITEELVSKAYVDATNIPSISGYGLLGVRLAYHWQSANSGGEIFFCGRNLTGQEYIAFSEPDPDGNSYQPGPTAEVFVGIRCWFK